MENLEIEIKYEKLYFDDVIYVFETLRNTTKKFFMEDKYWYDESVMDYLKQNFIKNKYPDFTKAQYYETISTLKTILKRGITFEITEWDKGSLKIKASFVVAESVLIPLVSTLSLPAGLTVGVIIGLALLIYQDNEKDYDERLKQLKKKWMKKSKKDDRHKRGIYYNINNQLRKR